jgi:hypothetical protein
MIQRRGVRKHPTFFLSWPAEVRGNVILWTAANGLPYLTDMKLFDRIVISFLTCCAATTAFGWGEEGHKTIGAMADKLIAGTAAAAHVHDLLGDETLSTASVWADQVKGRRDQTPEMLKFKQDNPRHFVFHYTDIPFEEPDYRDNSIGATNVDVIHAIPACILILQGKAAEQTLFTNVTPRVALRLLVHYLEDLHQPLHVGAGYLDGTSFVDPNGYGKPFKDDQGGNRLIFPDTNSPDGYHPNLHSFWDTTVVRLDMTNAHVQTPVEYATKLLSKPPPAWQDSGPLMNWDRDWAKESIALSAKVHDVTVLDEDDSRTDNRTGAPRPQWDIKQLTPEYIAWSCKTAEEQMTKAGYRVAAVLEAIWPDKQ